VIDTKRFAIWGLAADSTYAALARQQVVVVSGRKSVLLELAAMMFSAAGTMVSLGHGSTAPFETRTLYV